MTTAPAQDEIRKKLLDAVATASAEEARLRVERAADERAHAIRAAVEALPRGEGRDQVAAWLGVKVLQVDLALRRARNAGATRTLPLGALERVLDELRSSVPPLSSEQWNAVAFIVRGTIIDATWLQDPATLLADEIAEASEDMEFLDGYVLAKAIRSWSAGQVLAVIDACQQDNVEALPTT